ncbi:hypothetical protein BWI96_00940 [Siphonobacter sp. SORGH_AS_0500]|uniref:DUF4279 domain-containing protein n=1 Tax=Siphonobacter sp. SORGH_AS_0500 TaxID=1864824 RepID=UPI000CB84FC0|nr:DUF4279 domain-containing protein [Siphonobacter sp. SORGH_AS_0500]PKK38379.1 hypothetical protein BWI96_00940 [Siphonobacter sp. SORGH_AS_0500]
MTDQQVIELIEKEFKEKTLGVTEQYLEIHIPIYIDGNLKIDRIDREKKGELIIAYLPVFNERFYFAIYIDIVTNDIISIGTEAHNCVSFRADSAKFNLEELATMTFLDSTDGRNKGDKKGTGFWEESTIFFEPNPEPDEFEDKLKKLLDFLESDREGTKHLVRNAGGYIQVTMEMHNGNSMLGGPHIDTNALKRMSDLGLGINFDLCVGGKSFKD